jgi:hypothetical protein
MLELSGGEAVRLNEWLGMPTPWSNPTKHALYQKPNDAACEADKSEKHQR